MGSMPGMTMGGGGGGGPQLLPMWLAIAWAAVFAVVLVVHARHALAESGERRLWHCGHVLMALGMALMFLPASLALTAVSVAAWQEVFAGGAAIAVAWSAVQVARRRPVNALWPLLAVDLAAMIAMWSPDGWATARAWPVVAYFAAQSLLWISDRVRVLDRHPMLVAGDVPGGAGAVSATPLISRRDLRLSMSAMTLGMAFMVAVMGLAS
jgi:Domain of unknown function (DUF5134)